jgi:succinyl-CoA synthetase beta subunit
MRLYEHEAKLVLSDAGVRTPRSFGLVKTVGRLAGPVGRKVRYPAMVKAQVLIGGRGKAGGIKKVTTAAQATTAARKILGLSIGGYPVAGCLLEEAVEHSAACYLGITGNPATGNTVVMASAAGGVDIEQVARTTPDAIVRIELPDNPGSLPRSEAAKIAKFLTADAAVDGKWGAALAETASKLYGVYQSCDCKVVEINPLLITPDELVAADAKMVLDDNALYRQSKLFERLKITAKRHEVAEPTARERCATGEGFAYVDLLAEDAGRQPGKIYVGLVPGGAGYGIFSIDETTGIGESFFEGKAVPVNFMDSGGGPSRQGVAKMFSLLMDYPLVDVIVTSRFGGISSCDVFIRGLIDCLRERAAKRKRVVPIYGRMVGTDLPAARAYLESARQQTPDALEPLSMIVGNRKIMADVIREGLDDFLARKQTRKKKGHR